MNLLEEIARAWCAAVDVDPDELFDGKPCWTYYTDRAQALLPIIEKAVQAGMDAGADAIHKDMGEWKNVAAIGAMRRQVRRVTSALSASEIVKEMCGG